MNILVFPSWYPNKNNPVSGVFVLEQVKALKQLGVNVIVFFPFDKSIEKGKLVKFNEKGIITYRANTDYLKNTKISKIYSIIKSLKYLKKVTKNNNINLIHAHVGYVAGIISALYNKFFESIPYVITEHSSKVRDYSSKIYNKKLLYFAYKNADYVISVSEFLKQELKKLNFHFKSKIIGNIVDTTKYSVCEKEDYNNSFKGLFIGLMGENEVKGLQYFLPALADFINNNNEIDIKFTFVGDGTKRQIYEDMCKELEIDNFCKFEGLVEKDDTPNYIMNNDFLVLPSIKETFGSVLIEAMAAGKPVLTTKCGGPNEFVTDKVGVIVEPKNIQELEKGLKIITEKYKNYDIHYINEYAISNFSYKAIGNKLMELYLDILCI